LNNRKNVVLISASPKIGEPSVSGMLITMAERQMDPTRIHLTKIDVRHSLSKHSEKEDFLAISEAEAILIAFPLYFFCLPGMLMRFLMDYRDTWRKDGGTEKNQKIYAVVNCGFPEPEINEEAIRVVKSFSKEIGAQFRFGILIGGGGMLLGAKDAPFMKKSMNRLHEVWDEILEDVISGNSPCQDVSIGIKIPRKLYLWMGAKGFAHSARKNGLSEEQIRRRPYRLAPGKGKNPT
jgi:hypothetical protein